MIRIQIKVQNILAINQWFCKAIITMNNNNNKLKSNNKLNNNNDNNHNFRINHNSKIIKI